MSQFTSPIPPIDENPFMAERRRRRTAATNDAIYFDEPLKMTGPTEKISDFWAKRRQKRIDDTPKGYDTITPAEAQRAVTEIESQGGDITTGKTVQETYALAAEWINNNGRPTIGGRAVDPIQSGVAKRFAGGMARHTSTLTQPQIAIHESMAVFLGLIGLEEAAQAHRDEADLVEKQFRASPLGQAEQEGGTAAFLGNVAGQSVAQMALMFGTGGGSAAALAASAAAGRHYASRKGVQAAYLAWMAQLSAGSGAREARQVAEVNGISMSDMDLLLVGTGYALWEIVGEKMGLDLLGLSSNRVARKLGEMYLAGESRMVARLILQTGSGVVTASLIEGGEEVVTQYGQNGIGANGFLGGKGFDPRRKRTDGMGEAFLGGAFGGSLMAGPSIFSLRNLRQMTGAARPAINIGRSTAPLTDEERAQAESTITQLVGDVPIMRNERGEPIVDRAAQGRIRSGVVPVELDPQQRTSTAQGRLEVATQLPETAAQLPAIGGPISAREAAELGVDLKDGPARLVGFGVTRRDGVDVLQVAVVQERAGGNATIIQDITPQMAQRIGTAFGSANQLITAQVEDEGYEMPDVMSGLTNNQREHAIQWLADSIMSGQDGDQQLTSEEITRRSAVMANLIEEATNAEQETDHGSDTSEERTDGPVAVEDEASDGRTAEDAAERDAVQRPGTEGIAAGGAEPTREPAEAAPGDEQVGPAVEAIAPENAGPIADRPDLVLGAKVRRDDGTTGTVAGFEMDGVVVDLDAGVTVMSHADQLVTTGVPSNEEIATLRAAEAARQPVSQQQQQVAAAQRISSEENQAAVVAHAIGRVKGSRASNRSNFQAEHVPFSQLPRHLQTLVAAIKQRLGVEVVFFRHEASGQEGDATDIHGLVVPGGGRYILINTNQRDTGDIYQAIFAHELTHYLQDTGAWTRFVRWIRSDPDAMASLYEVAMEHARMRGVNIETTDQMEEFLSDPLNMQEAVARYVQKNSIFPEFWRTLTQTEPTLAWRIKTRLQRLVDLLNEIVTGSGISEMQNMIRLAEDALMGASKVNEQKALQSELEQLEEDVKLSEARKPKNGRRVPLRRVRRKRKPLGFLRPLVVPAAKGFEGKDQVPMGVKGLQPPRVSTEKTDTNAKRRATNLKKQLDNMDRLVEEHPNPAQDETSWNNFVTDVYRTDMVPPAPYRLTELINDLADARSTFRSVSQAQIDAAAKGLELAQDVRQAYESGQANPKHSMKLALWAISSRMNSPFAQETAALQAFEDPEFDEILQKVIDGEYDENQYKEWIARVFEEKTPARQSISNLNSFGLKQPKNAGFLHIMGEESPDGRPWWQVWHDLIADYSVSGGETRRRMLTQLPGGLGLQNKLFSFIMLVTGRTDVMILDRIQIRHMWDDGRYGLRASLYEEMSAGFDSLPGLALYEALERSLTQKARGRRRPLIDAIYAGIGRPEAATLGNFHWESWNLLGLQEATHGSMEALYGDMIGDLELAANAISTETRMNAPEYGARFRTVGGPPTSGGRHIITWTAPVDSGGGSWEFSPFDFRRFASAIRKRTFGVIPEVWYQRMKIKTGKFSVIKATLFNKDIHPDVGIIPWYHLEGINHGKLEEAARRFGRPTTGPPVAIQGADDARPTPAPRRTATGEGSTAGRSAAERRPGRTAASSSRGPDQRRRWIHISTALRTPRVLIPAFARTSQRAASIRRKIESGEVGISQASMNVFVVGRQFTAVAIRGVRNVMVLSEDLEILTLEHARFNEVKGYAVERFGDLQGDNLLRAAMELGFDGYVETSQAVQKKEQHSVFWKKVDPEQILETIGATAAVRSALRARRGEQQDVQFAESMAEARDTDRASQVSEWSIAIAETVRQQDVQLAESPSSRATAEVSDALLEKRSIIINPLSGHLFAAFGVGGVQLELRRSIDRTDQPVVVIFNIFTTPEVRNQGAAKSLINLIIKEAHSRGIGVELGTPSPFGVDPPLTEAQLIQFYRSLGFRRRGDSRTLTLDPPGFADPQLSEDSFITAAIKIQGLTTSVEEASFILPDGAFMGTPDQGLPFGFVNKLGFDLSLDATDDFIAANERQRTGIVAGLDWRLRMKNFQNKQPGEGRVYALGDISIVIERMYNASIAILGRDSSRGREIRQGFSLLNTNNRVLLISMGSQALAELDDLVGFEGQNISELRALPTRDDTQSFKLRAFMRSTGAIMIRQSLRIPGTRKTEEVIAIRIATVPTRKQLQTMRELRQQKRANLIEFTISIEDGRTPAESTITPAENEKRLTTTDKTFDADFEAKLRKAADVLPWALPRGFQDIQPGEDVQFAEGRTGRGLSIEGLKRRFGSTAPGKIDWLDRSTDFGIPNVSFILTDGTALDRHRNRKPGSTLEKIRLIEHTEIAQAAGYTTIRDFMRGTGAVRFLGTIANANVEIVSPPSPAQFEALMEMAGHSKSIFIEVVEPQGTTRSFLNGTDHMMRDISPQVALQRAVFAARQIVWTQSDDVQFAEDVVRSPAKMRAAIRRLAKKYPEIQADAVPDVMAAIVLPDGRILSVSSHMDAAEVSGNAGYTYRMMRELHIVRTGGRFIEMSHSPTTEQKIAIRKIAEAHVFYSLSFSTEVIGEDRQTAFTSAEGDQSKFKSQATRMIEAAQQEYGDPLDVEFSESEFDDSPQARADRFAAYEFRVTQRYGTVGTNLDDIDKDATYITWRNNEILGGRREGETAEQAHLRIAKDQGFETIDEFQLATGMTTIESGFDVLSLEAISFTKRGEPSLKIADRRGVRLVFGSHPGFFFQSPILKDLLKTHGVLHMSVISPAAEAYIQRLMRTWGMNTSFAFTRDDLVQKLFQTEDGAEANASRLEMFEAGLTSDRNTLRSPGMLQPRGGPDNLGDVLFSESGVFNADQTQTKPAGQGRSERNLGVPSRAVLANLRNLPPARQPVVVATAWNTLSRLPILQGGIGPRTASVLSNLAEEKKWPRGGIGPTGQPERNVSAMIAFAISDMPWQVRAVMEKTPPHIDYRRRADMTADELEQFRGAGAVTVGGRFIVLPEPIDINRLDTVVSTKYIQHELVHQYFDDLMRNTKSRKVIKDNEAEQKRVGIEWVRVMMDVEFEGVETTETSIVTALGRAFFGDERKMFMVLGGRRVEVNQNAKHSIVSIRKFVEKMQALQAQRGRVSRLAVQVQLINLVDRITRNADPLTGFLNQIRGDDVKATQLEALTLAKGVSALLKVDMPKQWLFEEPTAYRAMDDFEFAANLFEGAATSLAPIRGLPKGHTPVIIISQYNVGPRYLVSHRKEGTTNKPTPYDNRVFETEDEAQNYANAVLDRNQNIRADGVQFSEATPLDPGEPDRNTPRGQVVIRSADLAIAAAASARRRVEVEGEAIQDIHAGGGDTPRQQSVEQRVDRAVEAALDGATVEVRAQRAIIAKNARTLIRRSGTDDDKFEQESAKLVGIAQRQALKDTGTIKQRIRAATDSKARGNRKTVSERDALGARLRGEQRASAAAQRAQRLASQEEASGKMRSMREQARSNRSLVVGMQDALHLIVTENLPRDLRGDATTAIRAIASAADPLSALNAGIKRINTLFKRYNRREAQTRLRETLKDVSRATLGPGYKEAVGKLTGDVALKGLSGDHREQLEIIAAGLEAVPEAAERITQQMKDELKRLITIPVSELSEQEADLLSDATQAFLKLDELHKSIVSHGRIMDRDEVAAVITGEILKARRPKDTSSRTGDPAVVRPGAKGIVGIVALPFTAEGNFNPDRYAEWLTSEGSRTWKLLYEDLDIGYSEWLRSHQVSQDVMYNALESAGISLGSARLATWSRSLSGSIGRTRAFFDKGVQRNETKATIVEDERDGENGLLLANGQRMLITRAERMYIVASLMDQETFDLVVLGNTQLDVRGENQYDITFEDWQMIRDSMSSEEAEVLRALMEHINGPIKVALRAWSVQHLGYDKTKPGTYFPRHRKKEGREITTIFANQYLQRVMEGMSLVQERTEDKKLPVQVRDIFDEYNNISWGTYALAQMGPALLAARQLLNTEVVTQSIRRTVGPQGLAYYNRLFDEIAKMAVGGQSFDGSVASVVKGTINNLTKGLLASNPQVMVYQVVSAVVASTEINPLYVIAAAPHFANLKLDSEIADWSPQLRQRKEGGAMGIINEGAASGRNKLERKALGDKLMGGIAMFDAMAIRIIWKAATFEIDRQNAELRGDDRMRAIALRAERIVKRTQPMWDVLHSTGIGLEARRNPLVKAISMFRSQRAQNVAMIYMAALRAVRNPRDLPKQTAKIATVVIAQSMMIAGIKAMFDAFRSPGDDDDDEEKMMRFWTNSIDTAAGNIYLGHYLGNLMNRAIFPSVARFDPDISPITGNVEQLTRSALAIVSKIRSGDVRSWETMLELEKGAETAMAFAGVPFVWPLRTVRRKWLEPLIEERSSSGVSQRKPKKQRVTF